MAIVSAIGTSIATAGTGAILDETKLAEGGFGREQHGSAYDDGWRECKSFEGPSPIAFRFANAAC